MKSFQKFPGNLACAAAILFLGGFLALNLCPTQAVADNDQAIRVGVVNLQEVLKKYTRFNRFLEEWEAKREEIKKELIDLETQIAGKKKEMDLTLPSTERYAELYREISLLKQKLEFDSEYKMKQHFDRGERIQRGIFGEVDTIVKAYAAEKKFTAVFMSQELPEKVRDRVELSSYFQDVLYYDSSVDISGEISDRLNKAWTSEDTPPKK